MFWHKIFGNKKRNHSGRRQQSGFTFLEIVISLLVLTVGAFSMLQCVNVAMDANNRAIQEGIASNLASALMSEIMTKRFQENAKPTENLNFGIENGESRFLVPFFDDVDDYDVYPDETPPKTLGGSVMDGTNNAPNYSDFTRGVDVYYCMNSTGNNIIMTGNNGNDVPTPPWKCANVTVTAPSMKTVTFVELKVQ